MSRPGHSEMPRTVGEYRLEKRMGQGALGETWRARHQIWSERVVALKLLTSSEMLRSFRLDGVVSIDPARFASPHIVRVQGFDLLSPQPYIASELIKGQSLRERLNVAGRLPLAQALGILSDILRGLVAAHAADVVHRNLKPENVLIDEAGEIRLGDFWPGKRAPHQNLRLFPDNGAENASLAGTLLYLAPELRAMTDAPTAVIAPDPRSDLYAAGVLLFEMLTGELPQPGDRLGDFLSGVPSPVEALFARCFARIERRYPSAQAMLDEIQALRGHAPARGESTQQQNTAPAKDTSKHARPVPAQDTSAAPRRRLEAISTRSLKRRTLHAEQAKPDAHAPQDATTQAPTRRPTLSTRDIGAVVNHASITRAPGSDRAMAGSSESAQPTTAYHVSAPRSSQSQEKNPARVEDVLALIEALPEDQPTAQAAAGQSEKEPDTWQSLSSLAALYRRQACAKGIAYYQAGEYAKAQREFERQMSENPDAHAPKRWLAMALVRLGRPKEALRTLSELLCEQPQAAELWNNVGVVSLQLGKLRDAERALLKAVEVRPRYASAHANLGAVYQRMGRDEEARRESAIALEIDPDHFQASYNAGL